MIKKGTLRAVLGIELPDSADMIIVRYTLVIKSSKDKRERYKARNVANGHFNHHEELLSTWSTDHTINFSTYEISDSEDQRLSHKGCRRKTRIHEIRQTTHHESCSRI